MLLKIKHILVKLYGYILSIVKHKRKKLFRIYEPIFWLLPIKKNRIVFSSFTGNNYSCNPRAIYEYLIKNYGNKFEYVWLFKYQSNPEIPKIVKENAKCVQFDSLRSSYYKATSGIWCFNHRNTKYFHKRKNQLYIQTWHGDIGIKNIEKKNLNPEDMNAYYPKKCVVDSQMLDVLIVGSEWGFNNMREAFFFENGEYLKSGCPRNDILYNPNNTKIYNDVREKYGLDYNTKICLYAPTYRKGFKVKELLFNSFEIKDKIRNTLAERFGGEWVIFVKYHPACLPEIKKSGVSFCDNKTCFDVTDYGDVADLLVAADTMIADFSSVPFDFGLTRKPCWLYYKDLDNYCKNEGKMAIEIEDIRFPKSYSTEELLFQIKNFSFDEYIKEINMMYKKFGVIEDGNACEKTAKRIIQFLNKS